MAEGAGGKTTLAGRLCRVMASAVIVHTDDIAWMHSRFGWDDLMIKGALGPLHAGREVHYQPPAWQPNGRTGHVDVATGTSTVIVEGVGASRRQLADLVDVAAWVQSDFDQARRLGWAVTSSIRDLTRSPRCSSGASGRLKRSRSWSTTGHGNERTSLSPPLRYWPTIRGPRWCSRRRCETHHYRHLIPGSSGLNDNLRPPLPDSLADHTTLVFLHGDPARIPPTDPTEQIRQSAGRQHLQGVVG